MPLSPDFSIDTLCPDDPSRALLDAVIQRSQDACVAVDQAFNLVDANPAARELLGGPIRDLHGSPVEALTGVPELTRDELRPFDELREMLTEDSQWTAGGKPVLVTIGNTVLTVREALPLPNARGALLFITSAATRSAGLSDDTPAAQRPLIAARWSWNPATGAFTESGQQSGCCATSFDEWLGRVAAADQERVSHAVQQIDDGTAAEFEIEYALENNTGENHRAHTIGHVVKWGDPGDVLEVVGMTIEFPDKQSAADGLSHATFEIGEALESAHQGIWEWNARDNTFKTSAGWRKVFGYTVDDVHTELRDIAKLAHPDDLSSTHDALIAALKGHSDEYDTQQRIRHKNGTYLHCLARGKVVERDSAGRALRMIGTHTDITSLVTAQEALAETNNILSFALEHGKQGIWEWNCINDEFTHFGHAGDDDHPASQRAIATGEELIQLTHPEDRARILRTLTAYLRGETDDYAVEQRVLLEDGTYRTYLARGRALEKNETGQITRILGSSTDITQLKADHRRLHLALENGRQGMWEWEPASDHLNFSDSWLALFQFELHEIAHSPGSFHARVHPDDRSGAKAALIGLLKGESREYTIEFRFRTRQSGYIWIMERARVIEHDAAGRATLVVGTHIDISEQKAVERELKQSRRLLSLVIDTIPSVVYWKDTQCRYLGANRTFAANAGLAEPGDIVGLTDFDLPWAKMAAEFQHSDYQAINNGQIVQHVDDVHFEATDEFRQFETTKTPLLDEHGEIIGVLGVSEEISAQRRYQKQLGKLAESITGNGGERLLDALTRSAVELSGVANAFVASVDTTGKRGTIVSTFPSNEHLIGLSYDLAISPCSELQESDLCLYPRDVQETYPDDVSLAELGIDAYIGRRLVDQQGRVIGIIALMNRKPIDNPPHAVSVIDIMAPTAAAELQRESREFALRESEERYRTTYDNVPVMICTVKADDTIIDANKAWERATGYRIEETVGRPLGAFFTAESLTNYARLHQDSTADDGPTAEPLDLVRSDGNTIQVSYNATRPAGSNAGAATIAVLEDVTDKLQAEQQLRLAATAFQTHEALVIRDADKRVLQVNNAFRQITGYTEADVLGRLPEHLEQGTDDATAAGIWRTVDERGEWDGERMTYRADGTAVDVWQTITAVRDDAGHITHYVENSTDVSELKEALAEAKKLALYDPLTELPNRRYLAEQLESSIAHARRNATRGALLFIDLDQFKHINDSLGHNVGDELLIQVAKRLRRLMRKEDTIARLGGDEFVIVLRELGGDTERCVEQARRVADKVHHELGKAYEVENHEFNVTPTIGVTLFPEDGKTADMILQEADSAMYKGKAEGRNTTKFFHPSMQSEAQMRHGLERDLRTAAERDELSLHFQPQYDREGKIFAAETLLRWNHPSRGFVSPGVFIPIAEESGLILDLSRWVFTNAIDHIRRWERDGLLFIDHLAINVSSRQFRSSNFVTEASRDLVAAGVPAERVVIEVTEGTVIDNFEETARRMSKLREIGVRFSVDDFGVGYSSLSYLSRLPLDQLKIDRSFVTNVLDDPNDAVIAETLIGMGKNLKLQTIAEGVETDPQLQFLRDHGCDGFQGYLLSKPLPEPDFLELGPHVPEMLKQNVY